MWPQPCALVSGKVRKNKAVLSPGGAGPEAAPWAHQSQLIGFPADRKADGAEGKERGGCIDGMGPGPGLRRRFQAP